MFLPAPDESIWLGALRLSLGMPGARSLKDKRKIVAQVRDRLRARFKVGVAEVGHLEAHHCAILAVTAVSNDPKLLRSRLDSMAHAVADWRGSGLISWEVEINRAFGGDEWTRQGYDSSDA